LEPFNAPTAKEIYTLSNLVQDNLLIQLLRFSSHFPLKKSGPYAKYQQV